MAEHIMQKFVHYDRNILSLLNALDDDNRVILLANLYANEDFVNTFGLY